MASPYKQNNTPKTVPHVRKLIELLLGIVLAIVKNKHGIKPNQLHEYGLYGGDKNGKHNWLPFLLLQTLRERGLITQKTKGGKYVVIGSFDVAKKPTYSSTQCTLTKLLNLLRSRFSRNTRKSSELIKLYGGDDMMIRKIVSALLCVAERKTQLKRQNVSPSKTHTRRRLFSSAGLVQKNTPLKPSNGSLGEQRVKAALTNIGIKYENEVCPFPGSSLRCDFVIENDVGSDVGKFIIEFDGIQHSIPISYFGGEHGLHLIQERDMEKNALAMKHGYHMLRLAYNTHRTTNACEKSIQHFIESIQHSIELTHDSIEPLFISN